MLRFELRTFPNGAVYGDFFVGEHRIGSAHQVEGGWRTLRGSRVRSAQDIAQTLLQARLRAAQAELKLSQRLLQMLGEDVREPDQPQATSTE